MGFCGEMGALGMSDGVEGEGRRGIVGLGFVVLGFVGPGKVREEV